MTTHVALKIPDILQEIFNHIKEEPDPFSYQYLRPRAGQTLLSLALTCHAFVSPALDRLWNRLHSVIPLLSLLHAFEKMGDKYILSGKISAHEWSRFDVYASRVRELKYPDHDAQSIDSSVWLRLAQLGRSHLFPSLRTIKWNNARAPPAETLMFITPTLTCVDIATKTGDNLPFMPGLLTIFDTLMQEAGSLEHLSLDITLSERCLLGIKNFKNLRSLMLLGCTITDEMLDTLTEMDHLSKLCLHLHDMRTQDMKASCLQFKSLEHITLEGHLSRITQVLSSLAANSLVSVIVSAYDGRNQDFFELLRFPSLRKVNVFLPYLGESEETVTSHHIGPLLGLNELEHLTIHVEGCFSLDDEDVLSMAQAWPKIKTLDLQHRPSERMPTIGSFAHFARHCPSLVFLGLPIRADVTDLVVPPFVSHNLQFIAFAQSTVPKPSAAAVARVLDGFFPALDTRRVKFAVGLARLEGLDRLWDKVADALVSLQKNRRIMQGV